MEYLEQTVRELEHTRLGLLSTCHYTGFKATTRLWQAFPDPFVLDTCCKVIEAGKDLDRRVIWPWGEALQLIQAFSQTILY